MATGTFHINSQKYLRNILGKLHVPGLAGIDASPPFDPVDKSGRIRLGIDQFAGHLIIGHISLQCIIEPGGYLFAPAGNEPSAGIIIT